MLSGMKDKVKDYRRKQVNDAMTRKAVLLYHRRMREAYEAKLRGLEGDAIVQFVLAGYEVERRDVLKQLGLEVK